MAGPCATTPAATTLVADPCATTPAATALVADPCATTPVAPAPEGEAAAAPAVEGGEGGGEAAAAPAAEEGKAEEKGKAAEEKAGEKEGVEVGEKVAASGFATGFMAGFAEGGGIAEDEVTCIKRTLKDITSTFKETMKDLVGIAGELQAAPTGAHGKIREIFGKLLEIMELMKSLYEECLNAEARQKVKEEIMTLVKNLVSFQFMKDAIIDKWKPISNEVFLSVTLIVNREYEQGGEEIGKAMTLLLDSSPKAVEKYSVEDGSIAGRMSGTGVSYYSSMLIVVGLALVLLVVVKVARSRRAPNNRARAFSMGAGAEDVMIDDVDTEGGDGGMLE